MSPVPKQNKNIITAQMKELETIKKKKDDQVKTARRECKAAKARL